MAAAKNGRRRGPGRPRNTEATDDDTRNGMSRAEAGARGGRARRGGGRQAAAQGNDGDGGELVFTVEYRYPVGGDDFNVTINEAVKLGGRIVESHVE